MDIQIDLVLFVLCTLLSLVVDAEIETGGRLKKCCPDKLLVIKKFKYFFLKYKKDFFFFFSFCGKFTFSKSLFLKIELCR